ncbi:hypothetical protein MUP35_03740 [Patescibacteria group bacterium]|nr:hypothetical protein [Patescibacteria group bacterium]
MKKFKNYLINKIIKAWWFPWLLVGIVLRLLLMPFTLHPDLLGHSFSAYFLAYQGEWNLYETLAHLPQSHPLVQNFGVSDIFIYPPLAYYTLGLFRILVKPLVDPNFIPWLMQNPSQINTYPHLFSQLFLFKLPYLFIDIALAFVLSSLFQDQRKKKQAFLLWLFNPLALYATFMMGQLDLLPVFFTVLAVWFAAKGKKEWALVFLGIGGGYKMFPLLLIPVAAFVLSKTFRQRIKLLFLGFLPFVLSIAPFLSSKAFRAMVLFSPKSQKMLFMGWPVSGAEVIYPFIIGLIVIYLFAYFSQKKIHLVNYFLAVFLLIFSVTHYHPQWFLWITPFLIWELVVNKFKNLLLTVILFVGWLVITFLFEPSLSLGLFNPLWPQLNQAPDLSALLSRYFNVFQFKSLIRSVFAGAAIFFILRLFLPRLKNEA